MASEVLQLSSLQDKSFIFVSAVGVGFFAVVRGVAINGSEVFYCQYRVFLLLCIGWHIT